MTKQQLIEMMEANELQFEEIAKNIWEHPQLGYNETYASTLQQDTLKEAGFRIEANVGNVETAFIAEVGEGHPIVGILGEFDALPGLSQHVQPTKSPIVDNGPGHGCGHNLLGTAGVEAAIHLKTYMEEHQIKGTLRYYGCSAEELLSGKTFMARAGVFDDLDVVYTWHPGSVAMTTNLSMQALSGVEFHFFGRTAHAAAAPHLGRSALDAVELTNVGANYLREHVPDGSRIHYQITNGGQAPNVVPDKASVFYFLRGKNRAEVDDLLRRMKLVAEGAAMMTETRVEVVITAGCYDTLPNMTLNESMYENAQLLKPITYTAEEQAFAKTLQQNIEPSVVNGSKNATSATRYSTRWRFNFRILSYSANVPHDDAGFFGYWRRIVDYTDGTSNDRLRARFCAATHMASNCFIRFFYWDEGHAQCRSNYGTFCFRCFYNASNY
ncbi:amidohydrolase [Kurthia senegalensis]|uniref:amidohydrolase n=1 Tax=Kurthia senegalensis TaxID=1033740 RepID=UPI000288E55D|nr:amidohydrolase [Kurthia senegalensis]